MCLMRIVKLMIDLLDVGATSIVCMIINIESR